MSDTMSIDSWDDHAATPDVTATAHEERRRRELADYVNGRIRVYLDQKFWIDLMHAGDGGKNEVYVRLLHALSEKVTAGKIICPASEAVLFELQKNSKDESRLATAGVVQRLSEGVCIRTIWERSQIELACTINPDLQELGLSPRDLVWTKLAYVVGHVRPNPLFPGVTDALKLIIQKSFFDFMWKLPFVKMMDLVGYDEDVASDSDIRAEGIRLGGLQHAGDIRNFAEAYEAEAFGSCWLIDDEQILEEVERLAVVLGHPVPTTSGEQQKDFLAKIRNAAGFAISRKNDVAVRNMSSLLVFAHLHASMRMDLKNDPKAKFGGNDLFDFDHAAAAVGYCDYFFTERKLYRRMTRSEVALDKLYPCKMAFEPESALEMVNAI